MFRNFIKVAFRNLMKHKRFTLINILGLATGLAASILIMLWVQDELSYDQFHENADNIYVVFRQEKGKLSGATAQPLASALKADLPEVADATSIAMLPETFQSRIEYDHQGFDENIAFTDTRFFHMFSFDFIEGNKETAFENPNSIVLTERMSEKYFSGKNAIGQTLTLTFLGQKRFMTVTGVLKNIPRNSHFQRDFFVPLDFVKSYGIKWDSWLNQSPQTFVLTQGKIDVPDFEARILACKTKYYEEKGLSYSVLPLAKIHLHTSNVQFFSSTGDIKYVYIFSAIAGIILLIACINYMNLSNALSLKRTREIGIRKVAGACWSNLIRQHLSETLMLTCIALACGILIVEMFLPVLNQLTGKSLAVHYNNPAFLGMICLTALLTGLISGLYPALFITRFQPVQVLKQKFTSGAHGFGLQKGLVISQFALSTIIMICTVIVSNQLHFIKNTNLGFDKENIVCLKVKSDITGAYPAFKNKVLSNPEVLGICRSEPLASQSFGRTEGVTWPGKKGKFNTWIMHVDEDFASTFGLNMQDGRFYSSDYPSDWKNAMVLNEAAIQEMGLEQPIGKGITVWGRPGTIVGVTKNFHFSSLHHAIEPLVFRVPAENEQGVYFREVSVRIRPNSIQQSLTFLENSWKSIFPNEPFDFYFFDEALNANYQTEQRMAELFRYFSVLAILIACLGLYGLTAFTIERKFKDIGVHKILGATIFRIFFILSKKYLSWVLISNIIALPVAWFAMDKWLQNFAYQTGIHWWAFVLAGVVTLSIALLTISVQIIKAAAVNPVESLHYE